MNTRRQFLKNGTIITTGLLTSNLWAKTLEENRSQIILPDLEKQINDYIQDLRRIGSMTPDEKTAWLISDLTSKEKIVSIHENRSMQAASMIKIMVISAYLINHHKNHNQYPLTSNILEEMRKVVVHSNNSLTNKLINRLGGPKNVQEILQKTAPEIFQNIEIVETIPAGGRTYKNKASAGDYDRFLQALWGKKLPGSTTLLALMNIPNNDRISKGTILPTSAKIYDKTGSTSMMCGNTGIIACKNQEGRFYPYTFTAIIEKKHSARNYTSWIRKKGNVIRNVSNITFRYFAKKYNLLNS